jgi:thioredoxin reductase
VLARARRRVTVIDDQSYRNATVDEFHGFPTRDSSPPNRFRTDALGELHSYGVAIVNSAATGMRSTNRSVIVELADGSTLSAAAMLLATGVRDDLPSLDGLAARWGKSVFNCPFCDGWEHRDQPVVVIDAAPGADHLATMLGSWTPDVTVVGVEAVAALTGAGTTLSHVVLVDGSTIPAAAAFLKAPVTPRSSLALQLGCELDNDGYIITNDTGATSHPLVWAAGDIRRPPPMPHQVVLAAADGSAAAIAMHKAFVAGSLGVTEPQDPTTRGRRSNRRVVSPGGCPNVETSTCSPGSKSSAQCLWQLCESGSAMSGYRDRDLAAGRHGRG